MSRSVRLARDPARLPVSSGHLQSRRSWPGVESQWRRRPSDRAIWLLPPSVLALSRVCVGCISVAVWVFVRFT